VGFNLEFKGLKDDEICRLFHKQIVNLPLKFIAVSIDGFALLIKIFKFLVSQNLKAKEKIAVRSINP